VDARFARRGGAAEYLATTPVINRPREPILGRPIAETFAEAFGIVRRLYDYAYPPANREHPSILGRTGTDARSNDESARNPANMWIMQPTDEDERLRRLRALRILDTAPERAFDEITRAAASLCDAPVALITFVDEERCWFKAKVGLDGTHTPRTISFCSHLVGHDTPLVVPDAETDPRFATNPLVTSPPGIRFYAGAPLLRDGYVLGALCVVDFVPRQITATQLEALEALARHVVTYLELREALLTLQAAVAAPAGPQSGG
jgi:hypothetical protein